MSLKDSVTSSNTYVRFAIWCDRVHHNSPHDHIRPQVLDGLPGDRIIEKNTARVSQLLIGCLTIRLLRL
jgi:hypothetical protein